MDNKADISFPAVESWFQTVAGELLEVVDIDYLEDTIAVQYFDGTITEFDTPTWQQAIIGEVPPPEDFRGSLNLSDEDYGANTDFVADSSYADIRQYLDRY